MGGRTVFKFAMDGTSPDNWHWIQRKEATVYREYAAHGGAFPVIIDGLGVVGVVAVSGLPQAEDHQLVVDAMEDYMRKVGQRQ
ncbi:unnamed protein product [Rotaria sordida]|uniref:Heme-degrading domain-containing protein n=1 Tax=Rotaria sordida TaxID=392033 RepID=A0A815QAF0_9BILA|nr:unnamed protein product [Rotaria sordida]